MLYRTGWVQSFSYCLPLAGISVHKPSSCLLLVDYMHLVKITHKSRSTWNPRKFPHAPFIPYQRRKSELVQCLLSESGTKRGRFSPTAVGILTCLPRAHPGSVMEDLTCNRCQLNCFSCSSSPIGNCIPKVHFYAYYLKSELHFPSRLVSQTGVGTPGHPPKAYITGFRISLRHCNGSNTESANFRWHSFLPDGHTEDWSQ